jgi:hypothetical protein
MPVGLCKLCLEEKELQVSHLYPRSLYKALRNEDGGNPNHVLLTTEESVQKSGHITDYVLCRDCEQRLNRYGENWAARHVFNGRDFPLREILRGYPPVEPTKDDRLVPYAGAEIPEIDIDSLIFLGMSLFWRASVHQWTLLDTKIHLPLGAHEEQLRLYLRGKAPMPDDVCMNIMVCSHDVPRRSFSALGPLGDPEGERKYLIMLAGLHFMLNVKSSHFADYQWSTTHSVRRYIYTSSSFELMNAYLTASAFLRQEGLDAKWGLHLEL